MSKMIVLLLLSLKYLDYLQLICMEDAVCLNKQFLLVCSTICPIAQAQALLEQGADPQATTNDGKTPLHVAVLADHLELVRFLLLYDVNKTALDELGFTPLHWAADKGNVAIIKLLLDSGAPIDCAEWEFSPLHVAVCEKRFAAMRLLTQRGANVHALSPGGFEPYVFGQGRRWHISDRFFFTLPLLTKRLFSAIKRCDYDESVKLLERGAQVTARDKNGNTPFHWAAKSGEGFPVGFLIMRGSDPTATNKRGETPIEWAAECDHKTLKFLTILAT